MLESWNRDTTKLKAQQEKLKAKMNFSYVGHGPKATGLFAKDFKRKPGLYARCAQCGYYMPLQARGEETCLCGSLHRDERALRCEVGENEVEIFKGVAK